MVTLIDRIDVPAAKKPRHPEKAHRADTERLEKPSWIRVRAPVTKGFHETNSIVRENKLVTVCEEAGCPNIGECWDKKHATFHGHGRGVHPRLRFLQRRYRRADRAGPG